jgi:hypothetical protein
MAEIRLIDLLKGKTILEVEWLRYLDYDDKGYLLLEFHDGTRALIAAYHQGYTAKSRDEYQTNISVSFLSSDEDLTGFQVVS